jgi:glycosyltransferase involved in cell wall biosynthesis
MAIGASLKILSVYNRYLNRGGEDEVFESEAALLEQHGCDVTLVEEQVTAPRSLRQKIVLSLNAIWSRDWHARFQDCLETVRPDIVHVHNLVPNFSPSLLYACRKTNVPVVHTLHNYRLCCPASTFFRDGHICEECIDHSPWRGVRYGCYQGSRPGTAAVATMLTLHRWLGTWAETVDCYLVPSEFARQKFVQGGIPAERIVVKPNFVDSDPGVRNGDEYALFVGRLSPQKGVRTLLAAWERLTVPLVVVGDGPLSSLVEAAQVHSPAVAYRGRLPREQTLATMKQARFLVAPSEWYEPFGLMIVEAFACGVPVICSRLGAMEEIVQDGRTGLHFTPGDAGDLAAKVAWAWDHPDKMRTMGRNARFEYEAKYTAERNYEMLDDIYHRVLKKAGSVTVKFDLPASVSLDVNSPPGPNRGVPVPSMLQERPRTES